MIKLKKLLTELRSREQLQKIVNDIKNNININEYLFDFNIPPGIYKRVLQKCQNVNIKDMWGDTPLYQVCRKNNIQIVKLLLKHPKIDVNVQNDDGNSPEEITDNKQIKYLLQKYRQEHQR